MTIESIDCRLSNVSTDRLRWPNGALDGELPPHYMRSSDVLDCNVAAQPHPYNWRSEPYDVLGRPDIALQIDAAIPSNDENSYTIKVEVSLDGQKYTQLPPSMFSPDITSMTLTSAGQQSVLLLINCRCHFIQILIGTDVPPTTTPHTTITAGIVAGETS